MKTETKEKVAKRVTELLDKASANWPQCFFSTPTIEYNLQGDVAGYAAYSRNAIRLNAELLAKNEEDFIKQTVGHEVAHLVARRVYSWKISRSHGIEWQRVMQVFNLPADRCHSYETTPARVHKTHECLCSKCGRVFMFTSNRCNKMLRGYQYFHKGCLGKIVRKSD